MNTAQRLGRVQYSAHLQLDALYAPLAADAPTLVRRLAVPDQRGVLRITESVVPIIRRAIGYLLTMIQPSLLALIVSTAREAELVADPDRPVDDAALAMTGLTAVQSLNATEPMVTSQIGMLLVRGAAMQRPAGEVARTVSNYLSPWFTPRRNASGAILRGDRVGAIAHWPGRAGMASAHARTLMLTESTRAHARATLRRAGRDGQWVDYVVGAGHLHSDECDDLASRGPYRVENAPSPPRHPNCRCVLEPTDPPRKARAA